MEVNVLLFDDFSTLDAFGPADVFGRLPGYFHLNYLSVTGNIVNSMQGVKVWTEPLELERLSGILVIPGGRGARRLLFQDEEMMKLIRKAVEKSDYCMMISDGCALPAQTGILYHRYIADITGLENWKRMFMAGISFVSDAAWVNDGKFYSCKDSLAGISMALGIIADLADMEEANRIAGQIGIEWDIDDDGAYF